MFGLGATTNVTNRGRREGGKEERGGEGCRISEEVAATDPIPSQISLCKRIVGTDECSGNSNGII